MITKELAEKLRSNFSYSNTAELATQVINTVLEQAKPYVGVLNRKLQIKFLSPPYGASLSTIKSYAYTDLQDIFIVNLFANETDFCQKVIHHVSHELGHLIYQTLKDLLPNTLQNGEAVSLYAKKFQNSPVYVKENFAEFFRIFLESKLSDAIMPEKASPIYESLCQAFAEYNKRRENTSDNNGNSI